MLKKLVLHHVGPADDLEFGPVAPRFNALTGDNGLGKSFLLEAAWWALTKTWHETHAVPSAPDAKITYEFDGDSTLHSSESSWNPARQEWMRARGRPPNPGLIVYARIDGSFSTWDPARNYRLYQRADGGEAESPDAYRFSPKQVMDGLRRTVTEAGVDRDQVVCRGLIDDWTRWQAAKTPEFDLLVELLEHIGPDGDPLVPGAPMRPTPDDAREIPTIRMPYGQDVPLTYAPAGVRRMAKLAYLLAWTLHEHRTEAERIVRPLADQIIVLIDEPETHLHPRWQRTVLRGLQQALESWQPGHSPAVQFLVATHSPLVLASLEPIFDEEQDALWKLDLVDGTVRIEKDGWHKRGDANRWLESDVFDLGAATSREAEDARSLATRVWQAPTPSRGEIEEATRALEAALSPYDPFLRRWRLHLESLEARSAP